MFLESATTEEEAQAVEDFLLWNPYAKTLSSSEVTQQVWSTAVGILRASREPAIRDTAIDILCQYQANKATDVNGHVLMELWRGEADPALRNQLLDAVAWHGPFPGGPEDRPRS